MFIITPTYGQFPVDLSHVSDWPEDEEVRAAGPRGRRAGAYLHRVAGAVTAVTVVAELGCASAFKGF